MDTRFSSALHILILVSEAETPMTSEEIAKSVGTNASYIRKIAGLLKKQGIIKSSQGISGFRLVVPSDKLTLQMIYSAVYESKDVHIFDIHQNPNDECIVGKHIKPVLENEFSGLESMIANALSDRTLKDIIDDMRERSTKQGGKRKLKRKNDY